ncbi:GntR family transcriptional regulator [Micromonospora sp. NPDC049282]|uniref:GntR family transcriptional regulator n=1 Tax=Micromonospora sp. NPDC049282 TaxID=3364269 RepID=UPI00371C5BCA
MPDSHYGQPRYRAIANDLRRRILSGALPQGALLPAESSLTVELRASRGTIRQALAILREEGLIITEHGRGTYTNPNISGRDQLAKLETRRRLVPADQELASLFAIEVGAALVEQQRIMRTGGVTEEVVRSYQLPLVADDT